MADLERGQRIKAQREEMGLSQPEVVEEIERLAWALPASNRLHPDQPKLKNPDARSKPPVTLRGYQSWEAGGGIDPGKAKLLALALHTDVRALINGVATDAPTPSPFSDQDAAPDQLEQMNARLAGLEAQNELLLQTLQATSTRIETLETLLRRLADAATDRSAESARRWALDQADRRSGDERREQSPGPATAG